MLDGYPKRLAVTSLALFCLLATAPAPGCAPIPDLYAQRVRREVRSQLLLAYARAHASRAQEVLETLRQHGRIDDLIRNDHLALVPQETGNRRLNHLVNYIVAHCLRR